MGNLFNWKIFVTAFVVLGVLFLVTGSDPSVSGFFSSVGKRFSLKADEKAISRNVSFSLAVEPAAAAHFAAGNVGIGIEPKNFSGSVSGNRFSTDKRMAIRNFTGSVSLNRTLWINGSFDSMQIGEFLFVGGSIDAKGEHEAFSVEGLSLDRMELGGSGRIVVEGQETLFENSTVVLENPLGTFSFGSLTEVKGVAKRITIGGKTVIG